MSSKAKHYPSCATGEYPHEYTKSRTVSEDAFATVTRRQFYCVWCGKDRPRREKKERT